MLEKWSAKIMPNNVTPQNRIGGLHEFVITGSIEVDKKKKNTWWVREGNPLPKLKMTGNQTWMPAAKRYAAWKVFVQETYIESLGSKKWKQDACRNIALGGKPIMLVAGERAHMSIVIHWWDETHGDPENIFGSIADALFHNDKHLSVNVEFVCKDPRKDRRGTVDVAIIITPEVKAEAQKV